MVIKSLENIKKIGEYNIGEYININHDKNTLTFKIQDGPVAENGVNGCQVNEIIESAKIMLEYLNTKFHCIENEMAIYRLNESLISLNERKDDRTKRNVEGYNKQ